MKRIIPLLLCLFFSYYTFSQATCSTAVLLTPGNQQCGNSSGQPGDFPADGSAPINPCDSNYSDDEYWYEYTADGTQALEITLSNISDTYAGLFVFDDCPSGTPTCVAFAVNGSSTADINLETGILSPGTYKVVIVNWGTPDNTAFCIDAIETSTPDPGITVNCSSTINETYCYGNGENSTWAYNSSDGTSNLRLFFNAGEIEESFDVVTIYDGTNNTGAILFTGDNGGDLTGVSVQSTGPSLFLELESDGSISCSDGSVCCTTQWDWNVECDNTPSNNSCAGAIVLENEVHQIGSTSAATNVEALSPCSGGGGGGTCSIGGTGITDFTEGVWFVYTSGSAGESIIVDTDNVGTDFDTELQVFGGSCGSLVCIGGDDDGGDGTGNAFASEFCWETTGPGIGYYIYLDGHNGATGNYDLLLTILAPANDDCATASVLAMNAPGSLINQSFKGATNSGLGAEMCDASGTPTPADLWYSINTDADGGNLIITVEPGPKSDVVVSVYNNCGDPVGNAEACVDLGGEGGTETINFTALLKDKKGDEISSRDADYFVRVYEKTPSGDAFEIGAQGEALPIIIGSFEARARNRGNLVEWSTLAEINSSHVIVQSSPNGSTEWESIGKVDTKGESSTEQNYEMFDHNPYEVTYYRLNAVDNDGKSELSQVIHVRRNDVQGRMSLAPNPANTRITVQKVAQNDELATYSIIDNTGKIVIQRIHTMKLGLNTIDVELDELPQGLYLLMLKTSYGIQIEKFVKQ